MEGKKMKIKLDIGIEYAKVGIIKARKTNLRQEEKENETVSRVYNRRPSETVGRGRPTHPGKTGP